MAIDAAETFPDWLIPRLLSSKIFSVVAATQILDPAGSRVGAPWVISSSLLLQLSVGTLKGNRTSVFQPKKLLPASSPSLVLSSFELTPRERVRDLAGKPPGRGNKKGSGSVCSI